MNSEYSWIPFSWNCKERKKWIESLIHKMGSTNNDRRKTVKISQINNITRSCSYHNQHIPASCRCQSWSRSKDQQGKTSGLVFVLCIHSIDCSHRDEVQRQRIRLHSHCRRHQSCCRWPKIFQRLSPAE